MGDVSVRSVNLVSRKGVGTDWREGKFSSEGAVFARGSDHSLELDVFGRFPSPVGNCCFLFHWFFIEDFIEHFF